MPYTIKAPCVLLIATILTPPAKSCSGAIMLIRVLSGFSTRSPAVCSAPSRRQGPGYRHARAGKQRPSGCSGSRRGDLFFQDCLVGGFVGRRHVQSGVMPPRASAAFFMLRAWDQDVLAGHTPLGKEFFRLRHERSLCKQARKSCLLFCRNFTPRRCPGFLFFRIHPPLLLTLNHQNPLVMHVKMEGMLC